GGLCTLAAFWLLAAAARPRNLATTLGAALAPLLIAAAPQVMGWTTGGLEGPLAFALLVGGLLGVLDDGERHADVTDGRVARLLGLCWRSVPFALLVWTRPDGPLFAATVGLALALRELPANGLRRALLAALAFGALPALALAAQVAFRWFYYGDLVPNTAHVKVELGADAWRIGVAYVTDALYALQGIAWPALGAVLWLLLRRRARAALPVLLLPLLGWLGYLAAVGGDHFVCYRLLHPALAPLGLLVAWAARHLGHSRIALAVLAVATLTGTAANVALDRTLPLCTMVRDEQWEWQGKVVGEVLGEAFEARQPTIAVAAAGAVPFYSRLPALDLLGLCDRTIARTKTPAWAAAAAAAGGLVRPQGHLRGNGDYVMTRAPDLIQFGTPPGMPLPVFLSGIEFEGDPRFLDGYRLIVIDVPKRDWAHGLGGALTTYLWVRVEGRAGVARSDGRLEIPGHLLGGYRLPMPLIARYEPQTPERRAELVRLAERLGPQRAFGVVPAAGGALELRIRRAASVALELELPADAGAWHARVEPEAELDVAIEVDGANGRVTLTPRAGAELPIAVRQIVLTR
ncbi:MAG: hypothetical protein KDE27_06370, partial [Planctomycetes bacterium]|nr:hypothetical protein [Planctomycetota bacterium]